MNFLNIGPMELLIILMLALIVFGPSRLPEIGRALGKSLREFRRMTQEFTETLSELEEELGGEVKGASEMLTSTVSEVRQELEEASQGLQEAVGLGGVSSGGPGEDTSPEESVIEGEFAPVEEMAGEEGPGDEGQEEDIPALAQMGQEGGPSEPEGDELVTGAEG